MAPDFDDRARLETLRRYDLLDTPPEATFDDITALCADLLNVPIALITLVDEDRQWFKSRVGMEAEQTARSVAFCDHAIREPVPFVVADALRDPRFADNPLVTNDPNIRFYAGVQLRSTNGDPLGTLCAIDRKPRTPTEREMKILVRLARQVETHFELRRRALALERRLVAEEVIQRDKERLAALVVHDLRTPIDGILLAATMLLEDASDDATRESLEDISLLATDAQEMLADVLDICLADTGELRVRLTLLTLDEPVQSALRSVARLAENQGVTIDAEVETGALRADHDLLRRALGNLMDNAIRHAPRGTTIKVTATIRDRAAWFEVSDEGEGIEEGDRARVFEPHTQLPGARRGHGLGLAFCRVAASAHEGRVWVEENEPHGSRFVMKLPLTLPQT